MMEDIGNSGNRDMAYQSSHIVSKAFAYKSIMQKSLYKKSSRKTILIGLFALLLNTTGCVDLAMTTRVVVSEREMKHNSIPVVSRESYIATAGKPNTVEKYKNCEVLSYYEGLTWASVRGRMLGLPYIFGYPNGIRENLIYVRGRYAVGMTEEFTKNNYSSEYRCLILFGCSYSESRDRGIMANKDGWCE